MGISRLLLLYSISLASASDLCNLPDKNISLASLSQPYYQGFGSLLNSSLRIYISLCQPLSGLPTQTFCDKDSFVCITRIDDSGSEVEYIRDGGRNSSGLQDDSSHLAVQLDSGSVCSTDENKTVSTRISFFCTNNIETDNAIHYEGVLGECSHQLFWFSSLVCDETEQARPQPTSCIIKVPGYDAIIDLGMWANTTGHYTARSSTKSDAVYHLNLCKTIHGDSPCPEQSVLCQVNANQTKMIENLLNYTDSHSLTYTEEKEVINLHYPAASTHGKAVSIKVECNREAKKEPVVTMVMEDEKRIIFRFLTASACLVPPVQCVAQDNQGNFFDLSGLKTVEWEIGVSTEKNARYQIKVCGSLPISPENPCSGQAGICTYRFKENSTEMADAVNLGIMYKRPRVTQEGDIVLEYSHGELYKDDKGNSCNRSAEIVLKCSERELGPRFEEATACQHTFIWSTPDACPRTNVVSKDCTVREPLFSNIFNVSSLYNSSVDYLLQGANSRQYRLNVCGPLVAQCQGNETCLMNERTLRYEEGSLEMVYTGPPCSARTNKTLSARIAFECNHEVEVGRPVLVSEESCQLEVEWETNLACPPYQTVQCSVMTKEGLIDLSSLSLPNDNYLVESDNNQKFFMNLCRSLVHTNLPAKCPYHSAVCLMDSDSGEDLSLGQVHAGIKLNTEGRPYITYTLGSMCRDKNSRLGHMQTTIFFTCQPDKFDTGPMFLEVSNCHYIFNWAHAAACPVKASTAGNCSVTSRESGFTFDLNSLNRGGGWRWNESSHHFVNHLDLNVCGPLDNSPCGRGSGVCDNNKSNFGLANANLTLTDGQLMLVYPGGECPGEKDTPAQTRIRFKCPPRRLLSSGNVERDGPKTLKVVKGKKDCNIMIDFMTDLACDHQVYCDVLSGDSILPLTKLRRHDRNYRAESKTGSGGDDQYFINICGPLVPTDVPVSACNPQGVCGPVNGRYVGMGKVNTSPRIVSNGHVELRYEDGDVCDEDHSRTWSSTLYFTCNRKTDASHPFGRPTLVSVDNRTCESVFHVSTVLACNDTTTDDIVQPDSCQLYHPAKAKYLDLAGLQSDKPYKVLDKSGDEYYEIQPCRRLVDSCNGAVCKITKYQNFSLGSLNDVMYYPDLDELRVRYIDGDVCNSVSNQRFQAKIFYRCDPSVSGPGAPVLEEDGVLDCLAIFNWGSRLLCEKAELDAYDNSQTTTVDVDIADASMTTTTTVKTGAGNTQELVEPSSGTSWGHVFIVLALLVVISGTIYVYRNPGARERLSRLGQEVRARMPVNLGGRSRSDTTLLVSGGLSGGGGGSLHEDDDFYA